MQTSICLCLFTVHGDLSMVCFHPMHFMVTVRRKLTCMREDSCHGSSAVTQLAVSPTMFLQDCENAAVLPSTLFTAFMRNGSVNTSGLQIMFGSLTTNLIPELLCFILNF